MRILICSGEVSGDLIGGCLAAALRVRCPDVDLAGTGGSRMASAGVRVLLDTNHLGSVGFTEPLRTIPGLVRLFGCVRRSVRDERPEVAVLIGNDLFNAFLGRWLRRRGIRTLAYFPPQVWVWRSVASIISRSYDSILASFPEEEHVYRKAGARVQFVGHYLVDIVPPVTRGSRADARNRFGVPDGGRLVGLLPGSRAHELDYLAPVLLDAARILGDADRNLHFVLPAAEPAFEAGLREHIARRGLSERVRLCRNSHDAMAGCDLLLLSSGTATLEAALMGIPMVILYKVSTLTMLGLRLVIGAGLIHSETVGLPNLLAGAMIVPELRQAQARAGYLAAQASALLQDAGRCESMRRDLAGVARLLGGRGSLDRAAAVILSEAGSVSGDTRRVDPQPADSVAAVGY